MACCFFTAYFMNRIIQACELLDINIVNIQYNDFHDDLPQQQHEPDTATAKHGAGKGPQYEVTRFAIEGMTCAACTTAIETAVSTLPGVDRLTVSLPLSRATVTFKNGLTTPTDIVRAIEAAGYDARVGGRTVEQTLALLQRNEELRALRAAFSNSGVLACVATMLERGRAWVDLPPTWSLAVHAVTMVVGVWVQIFGASWIHRNAWRRKGLWVWELSMTMDTLISVSLLLGLFLSFFNVALFGLVVVQTYFASGAFLATIIIGGRYLDLLLKRKSVSTFASFYRLQSETANVKIRRGETYLPAVLLRPQDEIVIEAGSIIPCDGYIIEGTSLVDVSTMTGESMPAVKKPGDLLMSGTRNLTSGIVAIVSVEQSESSLQRLIESISSATDEKVTGNGAIDTLTAYFVKTILALTCLAFCWTYARSPSALSRSERINMACERAMTILAAACPCALGLATPSAVMAGLEAGWSRGIILTGGSKIMHSLNNLTHIVMDKTGTLTEGRLSVCHSSFSTLDSHNSIPLSTLCMYLCAAERHESQRHPTARVVFQWALTQLDNDHKRLQTHVELRNLTNELGKGISSDVRLPNSPHWHNIHIGNTTLLHDAGIKLPNPHHHHRDEQTKYTTVVHIAIDRSYTGFLGLRDTVRPEARAVIGHLKSRGTAIEMLTGDIEHEAKRVSESLDIDVRSSRQLPHDKKAFIQSLQAQGHVVAMLGDGLNDFPAQAAADVGIQFSLSTSSCIGDADTSTGVVITSPNLGRLPEMLEIARMTVRQSRRNIVWAGVYNFCAVSLAMGVGERWGVRVNASGAATMMAFSSAGILAASLLLCRELRGVEFLSDGDGMEKEACSGRSGDGDIM